MKLRKSADNSAFEAKLDDRRIVTAKMDGGVQVRIKRIVKDDRARTVKEVKVKGNKTVTINAVCNHITDKKTAELVFNLSFEGAEGLLACLWNLYNENKKDFPSEP